MMQKKKPKEALISPRFLALERRIDCLRKFHQLWSLKVIEKTTSHCLIENERQSKK